MQHNPIKFIYWFAYYNLDSPSVRYRAKYPLATFKSKFGVDYCLIIPGYSFAGIYNFGRAYISALLFRKKDSLIVIQRVHSSFIYSTLLKLLVLFRRKDTVYDLDDADYLEKDPRTIYFFARHCHKISAGSKEIARHLRRFNDHIWHTTSPVADLNIVKAERNATFTIGWVGGFSWGHKESLTELVFPALTSLPFDFRLILIGVTSESDIRFIKSFFKDNKNIQLEMPLNIDWTNEYDIQKRIVSFDIGIATLADTLLQRSKSGIKAKQYMNNGVPVLSTDLPENNSVIRDRVNGYFCATPADFKDKIMEFYSMPAEAYSRFSNNARLSIRHFDHDKFYWDFIEIKKAPV